jgi:hypothetical protein
VRRKWCEKKGNKNKKKMRRKWCEKKENNMKKNKKILRRK